MALFSDKDPVMDMYWKVIQGGDPAQQFGAMLGLGLGTMFGGKNWGGSFEKNWAQSWMQEHGVPEDMEALKKMQSDAFDAGAVDVAERLSEKIIGAALDKAGKTPAKLDIPNETMRDIMGGLYVQHMAERGIDVNLDTLRKGKGEYAKDFADSVFEATNLYRQRGISPSQYFQLKGLQAQASRPQAQPQPSTKTQAQELVDQYKSSASKVKEEQMRGGR